MVKILKVTKHCLRIKTGYRSLLTRATFCQCVQLQPAIKIAIYLLVCCINFSQSAELWYRIIQIWRRHTGVGYYVNGINPWWRHQMKTFSALLAICAGNSPVPVNFPHKGQWRGALMFALICVWINAWVNNRKAGDLRRYCAHYDVIVMLWMMYGCQFHNSWNIWCNKLRKHLLQFCTPSSLKAPNVPFTGHPYTQLCEKFVQQTSRVVHLEV